MRVMEERESLESPNGAPWLVFPYGEGKKNHAFYNIFDSDNTNCRNMIPELSGKTFWQKPSHQGWLIVLCDVKDEESSNWKYGDCFLLNPLTLETIQLPSLLEWITNQIDGLYTLDCLLSSPPRTTANEDVDSNVGDDPLVLILYQPMSDLETYTFLFCHPGEKQWRTQLFSVGINGELIELEYLHCFKDKLYALGINGDCVEIEKKQQVGSTDDNSVSLSMKSFQVSDRTSDPLKGARDGFKVQVYFVEGRDDLYMINVYFNDRGSEMVVISICIARLDFSSMEWELVNSLGDDVLFVGRKNRVCCSAAKLGLARGCLYYNLHVLPVESLTTPADLGLYKFEVEDAGVYDISPCLRLQEPVFAPDWILMPDGQRRKDGTLRINKEDRDLKQISLQKNEDLGGSKISISNYKNVEDERAKQIRRLNAEEQRSWDILNEDMVVLIAGYLHPLDYVHFRAVCKANRQIMPVVKSMPTSTQILETTSLFPWLLFSRDNCSTVYNLVNPMHDHENYFMNFSELLKGATIRFQRCGWLLMSREEELFFYNPFTREIIQLPDLPGCYYTSDISFSCIPTSSDCIVFAIEGRGLPDVSQVSIHCIRRGEQNWVSYGFDVEIYSPFHNTPTSFGGSYYSVGYNGAVRKFDLEDGNLIEYVLKQPGEQFQDSYPSFLVACEDDLLLVKLGCLEMPVRLFRLDIIEMEWVKVESLGKHILFISDITCFSAAAPNRQMENKVYFPRLCLNGEGVLFYSLETGSYQSFGSQHFAKNFCGTKGWLKNCAWIEPNWLKSTPQELDWFKHPSQP